MKNGSTRGGNAQSRKPEKPYDGFPLFPHAAGQWAKKIRGKLHYFGVWATPEAALERFNRQWPFLKDGRVPPPEHVSQDGATVREVCNDFLESKHEKVQSKDLSLATFQDYFRTCELLAEHFGDRRLDDLRPEDFRDYRAKLAKGLGVQRLKTEITRTRMVFGHAFENELVEKPIRFGSQFEKPSAKRLRRQENERKGKLFSREEIVKLMAEADVHLRAMIYLGANAGFGNSDVSSLPRKAVDLKNGWIEFPRPKTEIMRRVPLWPETVQVLRESLQNRPEPASEEHAGNFFLTASGKPWVCYSSQEGGPGTLKNWVSVEFRKLLRRLDINGRKGLGFYTLRHVFETIAGESKDQVAVDAIMGHVDSSMAANYRHGIGEDRLRDVVGVVHGWLFPKEGGVK